MDHQEKALKTKLAKDVEVAKRAFESASKTVESIETKYQAQIGSATADKQAAEQALRAAAEKLMKFDSVFGDSKKNGASAPAKKAAPAKAAPAKKAAAPAKKTVAKAGPAKKTAAKKTVKKGGPKTAASRRAAEGRREVLEGLRPPIKDAIAKVLGSKTMQSQAIFDALKEKGWLPKSNNQRGYVSYVLSSNKDHFESVKGKGRGHYRLRPGVSASNGAAKKSAAKPAAKKAAAKAAPAKKTAAAASKGKQRKCGVCGELGHNSKSHKKGAAKASAPKAAAPKAAPKAAAAKAEPKAESKVEAKAETKAPEPKSEPVETKAAEPETKQSADDILNEVKEAFGAPAAT